MKKKLLHSVLATFLSVVLIICFSNIAFSQGEKSESKAMKGLSAIPSFYGPGLGLRSWSSPQIGWGAEIQPSWEFNDFTARVRFMYTLSTGKKARWYGLLTAGYMAVNEEYSGGGMTVDYSVSMPTFAIGIGWELISDYYFSHSTTIKSPFLFS